MVLHIVRYSLFLTDITEKLSITCCPQVFGPNILTVPLKSVDVQTTINNYVILEQCTEHFTNLFFKPSTTDDNLANWSHNFSSDKARYQTNQHRQGSWNWLHPNGNFTFLWGLLFQLSSTWLLWSGKALLYFRTGFMEFWFQYLNLYGMEWFVKVFTAGWGSCWIG